MSRRKNGPVMARASAASPGAEDTAPVEASAPAPVATGDPAPAETPTPESVAAPAMPAVPADSTTAADASPAPAVAPQEPVAGMATVMDERAMDVAPAAPLVATGPSVAEELAARDAKIADLTARLADAHTLSDRVIAELEGTRDLLATSRESAEAMRASFNAAWRRREAEWQNARPDVLVPMDPPEGADTAPMPAPEAPAGAVEMVPVVHHASVMFRGRVYEPGAAFPFDPRKPPEDVSATFREGIDFRFVPRKG